MAANSLQPQLPWPDLQLRPSSNQAAATLKTVSDAMPQPGTTAVTQSAAGIQGSTRTPRLVSLLDIQKTFKPQLGTVAVSQSTGNGAMSASVTDVQSFPPKAEKPRVIVRELDDNCNLPLLHRAYLTQHTGTPSEARDNLGDTPHCLPASTSVGLRSLLALAQERKKGNTEVTSQQSALSSTPKGSGMTLREGSYPTKWLPVKSVQTPVSVPRKEPRPRTPPPVPEKVHYYTLTELERDASQLDTPWVRIPCSVPNKVCFGVLDGHNLKYKVEIAKSLEGIVTVQGISSFNMNFEKSCLRDQLKSILTIPLCLGITDPTVQNLAPLPSADTKYHRIITNKLTPSGPIAESVVRARACTGMADNSHLCIACKRTSKDLSTRVQRRCHAVETPLGKSAPLTKLSPRRLVTEVKSLRKKKCELVQKVKSLESSLQGQIELEKDQSDKLRNSIDMSEIQDPLAKLFWQQQSKAFGTKPTGMRWHPMMIRVAILIHSQSKAAYMSLKEMGVLKLPGESTLRDYTNYFHPTEGFNVNVLDQLKDASRNFKEHQRFVVLLHDEMTIQSDLVYDRRSGEVVGFVHPHRWNPDGSSLATHVLCFMVVGVNTSLKMSMGYCGTRTATAADLMPLFWKAIGYLESYCGLKVIASTSDKGTPNQRLYRLHAQQGDAVCYKTVNIFAPDRNIYFISDAPHLVKTVRNNIASSGWGKNTKRLWNDGKEILWAHIVELYRQDQQRPSDLRKTQLTTEHVHLTSFSVMRVNLAAQVLSRRVARALRMFSGPECQETANFIHKMNRFFDCLNTRSLDEHAKKIKEDMKPYKKVDDERFTDEFLGYLRDWKTSVEQRPGAFTKGERNQMFLSYQTYEGLQMTVHSFIEATRYLISHGVEYVLSETFNQDPLEEHFGRHRGLGRRSTNPTLWTFGYQEQKIRLQRTLALKIRPRGNVRGQKRKAVVTDSPLKKIRRH